MSFMKTAVIIAGGAGERLRPHTDDLPKAMVSLAGKPLIYWTIHWLKRYDIKHVVIGVAYKKEKIIDYIKENNNFGLKIDFSEHTVTGGTAEAFKLAIKRYVKDDNFVAMNSDELTNMDLNKVVELHNETKPLVTMALSPFYLRVSMVETKNRNIVGFTYGKKMKDILLSCGIYIFNSKIVDHIPDTGSIEDAVFRKFAGEGDKMVAYIMSDTEEWATVNNIKELGEAAEKLREWGIAKKEDSYGNGERQG